MDQADAFFTSGLCVPELAVGTDGKTKLLSIITECTQAPGQTWLTTKKRGMRCARPFACEGEASEAAKVATALPIVDRVARGHTPYTMVLKYRTRCTTD